MSGKWDGPHDPGPVARKRRWD